jgi:hypothetical protein
VRRTWSPTVCQSPSRRRGPGAVGRVEAAGRDEVAGDPEGAVGVDAGAHLGDRVQAVGARDGDVRELGGAVVGHHQQPGALGPQPQPVGQVRRPDERGPQPAGADDAARVGEPVEQAGQLRGGHMGDGDPVGERPGGHPRAGHERQAPVVGVAEGEQGQRGRQGCADADHIVRREPHEPLGDPV